LIDNLITEEELLKLRGEAYSERLTTQEYRKLLQSSGARLPKNVQFSKTPLKVNQLKAKAAKEQGLFTRDFPFFEDIPLEEAIRSERNKTRYIDEAAEAFRNRKILKTATKKAFNLKKKLGYSAFLAGTAFLLPGDFGENLFSSLTWEAAAYGAGRKGIKGWKQLAVGAGAGMIGKGVYNLFSSKGNRFSGFDDEYNTIEGLHPGGTGLGARSVKDNSDFGSGFISKVKNIFKKKPYDYGKYLGPVEQKIFNYAEVLGPKRIEETINFSGKGFSSYDVQALGELANRESVPDFAKRMGVSIVEKNSLQESLLTQLGGAGNVFPVSSMKDAPPSLIEQTKTLAGFGLEEGKAYVSPSAISILSKVSGKEISSKEEAASLAKSIIFHEATEAKNAKAFIESGASASSLVNEQIAHKATVAQEELFLRSMGKKETYKTIRKVRQITDPDYRIPGGDDAYNTIEGLRHGGMSQQIRKLLTEFGSGWDRARQIAVKLYKGMDKEEAFRRFTQSSMFKESISTALKTEGKLLGQGLTADVFEYTAKIKHGIKGVSEELPFVVKKAVDKRLIEEGYSKNFIEELHRKTFQAEESALKKLGTGNAPSLYGSGENYGMGNALFMEKFEGEIVGKSGLSLEEAQSLFGSIKEAHRKGIRHTDLHGENIMRLNTEEGKRLGVLDFGMANRLTEGTTAEAWKYKQDIAQEAAQSVFGRNITSSELEESIDISRVYARYLQTQGKMKEAGRLHSYYSSFIESQSTSKLIEDTENLLRTRLEAERVLGKASANKINSIKTSIPLNTSIQAKEEIKTMVPRNMIEKGTFARGKPQPPATPEEKGTFVGRKKPRNLIAQQNIANRNRQRKRMENFNEAATNAVGIGLKTSHNGGKKHSSFSTIK